MPVRTEHSVLKNPLAGVFLLRLNPAYIPELMAISRRKNG